MSSSDELEVKLQETLKKINLTEDTMSTILGGLVVLIVGSLIFNYYRDTRRSQQITPEAAQTVAQVLEASSSAQPKSKTYTVAEGDLLWQIAEKIYGKGEYWEQIAQANKLESADSIATGQELVLPDIKDSASRSPTESDEKLSVSGDKYTIQEGDTLRSIALKAYGTEDKWETIAQANNLQNPDQLSAGMVLKIPR